MMTQAELEQQDHAADWPTYYGLRAMNIGDDGDYYVIIGHPPARQVIAALRKMSRDGWYVTQVDEPYNVEEFTSFLDYRWANWDQHPDRVGWIDWSESITAETPGAFPVVVIEQ